MVTRPRDRRSDKSKPLLSRVVQLRFTDEQYDRLASLAEAGDVPVSQLIRIVVEAQLLRDPNLEDLPNLEPSA